MGRARRRGRGELPFIGLDIGHRSLRVARVDGVDDRAVITALKGTVTPAGLFTAQGTLASRDALADCLRQTADDLGLYDGDVATAIGGTALTVVPLALPMGPDVEREAVIADALAPLLPYPVNEAVITWQAVGRALTVEPAADAPADTPPPPPRVPGLACAVSQALVEDLTAAIEAAGFDPLVIDAAPLAACRAVLAGEQPWVRSAKVVLGDLGASHTTWTLARAGVVQESVTAAEGGEAVTEALAAALEGDLAAAERHKRDRLSLAPLDDARFEPDSDTRAREAAWAVLERQVGTLQTLLGDGETDPVAAILLYGSGALLRGLPEALSGATGVPVRVADPLAAFDNRDLPAGVRAEAAGLAVCLGLALRPADGET